MKLDPITEYMLQEIEFGYVGKYSGKTADFIRTQMNKDPNSLSFFRMKRGEVLVAGTVAAAILIGMSIKLYKRYTTKIGRTCKDYTPSSYKHKMCAIDVKVIGRNKQLALLNSKKTQCKDTKDPGKCKSRIDKHVTKVKQQIQKLEAKKREYESLIKKHS